jgi:hypothetical protein
MKNDAGSGFGGFLYTELSLLHPLCHWLVSRVVVVIGWNKLLCDWPEEAARWGPVKGRYVGRCGSQVGP